MFKKDYQGGAYFDVYSVQGNQSLSKLKVVAPESTVRKKYDKDLRTFVLNLEGESTTTKIVLPKNGKQSLHLIQQYLVLQVFIYPEKSFSFEVTVSDKSNSKQRIHFSSSHREVVISSHHVKMPCVIIEQNMWLNMCLDLHDLLNGLLDGWNMQTIDSVVVSANCKLKRIFTMKENPVDNVGIPENMQLRGECYATQVIDINSLINAGIQIRSGTGRKIPTVRKISSRHKETASVNSSSIPSTELTVPKIRTTNFKHSENFPSNNKESTDPGMEDENDLACCGVGITLPKLNHEKNSSTRMIKSADGLKPKVNCELRLNSNNLSRIPDNRRVSDITHTSSYLKTRLNPKLNLENIESNSTVKLPRLSQDKHEIISFKNNSLKVLPSIEKKGEECEEKRNRRYSNHRVSVDDNPFLNVPSSNNNDNKVINSLTLGDDKMVDDYLHDQITSGDEECISVSSSGCATSSGSELYLYTSSPHSLSLNTISGKETIVNKNNTLKSPKESLEHIECTGSVVEQNGRKLSSSDLVNTTQNTGNDASVSLNDRFEVHQDGEKYLKDSLDQNIVSIMKSTCVCGPEIDYTSKESSSNNNKIEYVGINNNDQSSYAVRESIESDTMSWMNTSLDQSVCSSDRHSVNKPSNMTKDSPNMVLQKRIHETLGSLMNQSEDCVGGRLSDSSCSSEDSCAAEKLQKRIKNYRYQDEMKSMSCTFDLSSTIPDTPTEAELMRFGCDENNNLGLDGKLHFSESEELLYLLFDPVLNCYYDPHTHKYYELS